ncbi:MAG: SDR family oxidoreductase [Verrucomicrobiota bacterium]|nr:SDR family oxidoreductase [Verrucomicrobiota bacterium]
MLKIDKIMVTGALGHIGSYVIRDLVKRFSGVEVILVDNMMTQRYASLFDLPSIGRYRFHEEDVTTMNLSRMLESVDAVIHLAAITDAAGSFNNAEQVESNNYEATRKVAEACAVTGTRLISLSSTSVYGTQKDIVSEDCSPDELQPQSPYAETKLREEALVASLAEEKDLSAVIFRFGTIFGVSSGMRFHTAVNKFCWLAAMGKPITVWQTAYDQKRPYLDLQDAAGAIAFALEQDLFDHRIYNVLTQNATVSDIVGVIREFIPGLKVDFVDSPIMNQLSYEVSCKRITESGFKFSGDLREGIGRTISLLQGAHNAAPR